MTKAELFKWFRLKMRGEKGYFSTIFLEPPKTAFTDRIMYYHNTGIIHIYIRINIKGIYDISEAATSRISKKKLKEYLRPTGTVIYDVKPVCSYSRRTTTVTMDYFYRADRMPSEDVMIHAAEIMKQNLVYADDVGMFVTG